MAWYDDNRVQNRNARITEMMKQEPQTVDILNMGDSLSLATLTPMEMWRQKGYTSFNIGADGIRMPEAYYTVLRACEDQNPKYLMIETLMLFRYSEKQDMQMVISQPLYHRFTFLKYHSVWKPYVEGRGVKIYHKGYLTDHRGDPAYSSWDEELTAYDQLVEEMKGKSFGDIQAEAERARKEKK